MSDLPLKSKRFVPEKQLQVFLDALKKNDDVLVEKTLQEIESARPVSVYHLETGSNFYKTETSLFRGSHKNRWWHAYKLSDAAHEVYEKEKDRISFKTTLEVILLYFETTTTTSFSSTDSDLRAYVCFLTKLACVYDFDDLMDRLDSFWKKIATGQVFADSFLERSLQYPIFQEDGDQQSALAISVGNGSWKVVQWLLEKTEQFMRKNCPLYLGMLDKICDQEKKISDLTWMMSTIVKELSNKTTSASSFSSSASSPASLSASLSASPSPFDKALESWKDWQEKLYSKHGPLYNISPERKRAFARELVVLFGLSFHEASVFMSSIF